MLEQIVKDQHLRWYTIHTYSGHEKKVESLLRERIEILKMEEKITEIMIPTREKIVIADGKKRTVQERLFPGYVLVKMQLTEETWPVVRNTAGVTGFVGIEGKPTAMSEEEVNRILRYSELKAPLLEMRFKLGDPVRINDGPFSDMEGRVDSIDEKKGSLTVLVNIFGRETPVELDFLQVNTL